MLIGCNWLKEAQVEEEPWRCGRRVENRKKKDLRRRNPKKACARTTSGNYWNGKKLIKMSVSVFLAQRQFISLRLSKAVDSVHALLFLFFFCCCFFLFLQRLRMHHLDANKMAGEEARRQLQKNVASNIKHVLVATPHKAPTI